MSRWVFLRGLSRESAHWGSFPEVFRARVADCAAVVCPDLPGNGLRHNERSPAHIDALVDDLREQLTAHGERGPYCALGLSLGGMVAARWASRFPDELDALVLINTSARPFGRWPQRLRPSALPRLAAILRLGRQPEQREAEVWALTSARRPADAAVLAEWAAHWRAHPVGTANVLRQLAAAARCSLPDAAPLVPILTLCSDGDRLVDPRCSRALAAAWRTALAVHPTAGHDLPLDAPEWVVQTVGDWQAGLLSR